MTVETIAPGEAPPRTGYLAVGHVTIDVAEDGAGVPGGTALYAALLAARAGVEATVLTAGDPAELARALDPFAGEVRFLVEARPATTRLLTVWSGSARRQRVLSWAGELAPRAVEADILHLAPVARELRAPFAAAPGALVGLTPQGLLRRWGRDGWMSEARLAGGAAGAPGVVVLSEQEQPFCEELTAATAARGGVVAVTRGEGPATVRRGEERADVPAWRVDVRDANGAGDVFAAALLLGLSRGAPLVEATEHAHACAALRVTGPGPAAVPTAAAVAGFVAARH
ncbi:MAG TPA: PfkB family carbohydrate kinase [Solirubrobacteraceae bacterium]|nr:PfkB family carbohydrate kinase [Solirubrobacteraceae bacterium]